MPNFFNIGDKLTERSIVAVLAWLHAVIIPDPAGVQDDTSDWYFMHTDASGCFIFKSNIKKAVVALQKEMPWHQQCPHDNVHDTDRQQAIDCHEQMEHSKPYGFRQRLRGHTGLCGISAPN